MTQITVKKKIQKDTLMFENVISFCVASAILKNIYIIKIYYIYPYLLLLLLLYYFVYIDL